MDRNLAGQKMTDIYVRAFIRGMEAKRQRTDVHYRYVRPLVVLISTQSCEEWVLGLHFFVHAPACD